MLLYVAVTHLLLEEGADPDTEDNDGRTPLMSATICGHNDLTNRNGNYQN